MNDESTQIDIRYVYIMETTTIGRYKIGYSKHPAWRGIEISRSEEQPEEIKQVIAQIQTHSFVSIERGFHNRYKEYRVWRNREYFDFDNETLQTILSDFRTLNHLIANPSLVNDLITDQIDVLETHQKIFELQETIKELRDEIKSLKGREIDREIKSICESLGCGQNDIVAIAKGVADQALQLETAKANNAHMKALTFDIISELSYSISFANWLRFSMDLMLNGDLEENEIQQKIDERIEYLTLFNSDRTDKAQRLAI